MNTPIRFDLSLGSVLIWIFVLSRTLKRIRRKSLRVTLVLFIEPLTKSFETVTPKFGFAPANGHRWAAGFQFYKIACFDF